MLYIDGGDGFTAINICQNSQNCTVNRVSFTVCKSDLHKPGFKKWGS